MLALDNVIHKSILSLFSVTFTVNVNVELVAKNLARNTGAAQYLIRECGSTL